MVPINYVPKIKMFIHLMLLQYIRIICLSISCRRSKYTSNYFPSCSIPPQRLEEFIFVTMVMDTPPSHLLIAPMRVCVYFPRMLKKSSSPKFVFTSKFACKPRMLCISSSINRKMSILYWRSCASLGGGGWSFFLQVLTTDFNSFRRGKCKVVRSLVSQESYENYSFVALVS